MPDCSNTLSGSRCRRAAAAGLIFFRPPRPCALLPPPLASLYLSGLLQLPGPVCALCGTVCLSVCLSPCLIINGPRSQTVLWETVSVHVSLPLTLSVQRAQE